MLSCEKDIYEFIFFVYDIFKYLFLLAFVGIWP